MFQQQTLLYCDPASQDDTLTKTALEWAVENNDRLCTTEILHQEYECHKDSKRSGLNCLRDQVLSTTPKMAQVIKSYREPNRYIVQNIRTASAGIACDNQYTVYTCLHLALCVDVSRRGRQMENTLIM